MNVIQTLSVGCPKCKKDMYMSCAVLDEKYQVFLVANCDACNHKVAVSLVQILENLTPNGTPTPKRNGKVN